MTEAKRMSAERLADVHRRAKEGLSYGPLIVIELCEALVAERADLEAARATALEELKPMLWEAYRDGYRDRMHGQPPDSTSSAARRLEQMKEQKP